MLHFNRRHPAFTHQQLIETLYLLFESGDITADRVDAQHCRPIPLPTKDEISAALYGAIKMYYSLTLQGGERWVQMAHFDWRHYIRGFDDDWRAVDTEAIEMYRHWHFARNANSIPPLKCKVTGPWKPTYWKTLPVGVRAKESKTDSADNPSHEPHVEALWEREWDRQRHGELVEYIPPSLPSARPVRRAAWRKMFQKAATLKLRAALPLLDHPDTTIQYAAALRLLQIGGQEAKLLEWFSSRRSSFSLQVIRQIPNPQTLEVMLNTLDQEDWTQARHLCAFRYQLYEAIAHHSEAGLLALSNRLPSLPDFDRIPLITILGQAGSSLNGVNLTLWESEQIFSEVQDTLAGEKIKFALQLVLRSDLYLRDRSSAGRLLAATDASFQSEAQIVQDKFRRCMLRHNASNLVEKAFGHRPQEPLPDLVKILDHADPHFRYAALTLLCQYPEPLPWDRIRQMLEDAAPQVRATAVYALGSTPLTQHLANDPSPIVRSCYRLASARTKPAADKTTNPAPAA